MEIRINKLTAIGLIISTIAGMGLDTEYGYNAILCILIIGLTLSAIGLAESYRQAKLQEENQIKRMLERERRRA